MRCTVPVPMPSDLATFKIPTPFASCLRTFRSVAPSIFGRPSFTPCATARLRPALTRWRIIVRSNSANAPVSWKTSLPIGVIVSMACWSRYKSTPHASRCWIVSSKPLGERPRRSSARPSRLWGCARTDSPYGALWNIGPVAVSLRLDVGGADHLAPFLGFFGDQLAELGRRSRQRRAAEVSETGLHLRVVESRVDLLVELVDDLGRRGLRYAEAVPITPL